MKSNNLILIGFMGAGKTTIGRSLSYRLKRSYVDSDKEIERLQGMTVKQIFEKRGEEEFRKLETEYLESVRDTMHHGILATGGGLPINENNHKLLKNLGRIYYLKVDEDVARKRILRNTKRPLAKADNPKEAIHDLFIKRESVYEKLCDVVVIAGDGEPDKIVDFIAKDFEKWEKQKNENSRHKRTKS